MPAPVWMAFPPEVHSALLSSGTGPESLLAAAGAWNSLSAEYASVADELGAVVTGVQAGVWEGPSAESYVAANAPFVAWLVQASADSAVAAAQHETVAAAFTAALAAMPTLAELAANHAIHAVLVATNFFGINTIPIALNEADYVRMWVQAAMAMTAYQAVSGMALASTPQTSPAPPIVKTAASTSAQTAAQGQGAQAVPSTGLGDLLSSIADQLGLGRLVDEFGIDHIFQFLNNPVAYTEQLINRIVANPLAFLANPASAFFDGDELPAALLNALPPFTQWAIPALAFAPAGAVGGVAGMAGAVAPEAAEMPAVEPAPSPVAAAPEVLPAAGMAPTVASPAAAPATVPAPTTAPATSTVVSSAPPSAPPATAAGFFPPYVVGPPGTWFDSGIGAGASSSAKRKAPEPDSAAAATTASAREQARARRRRGAKQLGYGEQFMDMNVDVDPDWGEPLNEDPVVASDRGAGTLGLAGAANKSGVGEAAGLTMLAGDAFGGGPTMPMVPGSWGHDPDENGEPRGA
jgi:PPE-repeat protein